MNLQSTSSGSRGRALPDVVVFDVIGTLVSIEPLRRALVRTGLRDSALELFFAKLLRDAMSLEISGVFRPFEEIARAAIEGLRAEDGLAGGSSRVDDVLEAFHELPAHPDVEPAVERLRRAGVRLVALTNGSPRATESVLERARIRDALAAVITVEDVGHYKPHRATYLHAVDAVGVAPSSAMLVAAHSWDVHGAKLAGLLAAWVRRIEAAPNPVMAPPDLRGRSLVEVADAIVALAAHA